MIKNELALKTACHYGLRSFYVKPEEHIDIVFHEGEIVMRDWTLSGSDKGNSKPLTKEIEEKLKKETADVTTISCSILELELFWEKLRRVHYACSYNMYIQAVMVQSPDAVVVDIDNCVIAFKNPERNELLALFNEAETEALILKEKACEKMINCNYADSKLTNRIFATTRISITPLYGWLLKSSRMIENINTNNSEQLLQISLSDVEFKLYINFETGLVAITQSAFKNNSFKNFIDASIKKASQLMV